MDYPYQFQQQAVDWIEAALVSDSDQEAVCHGHAERIFKIN